MIKLSLQVPTLKNCNAIAKLGKTHIYEKEGIKKTKGGWWCICMHVFDLNKKDF